MRGDANVSAQTLVAWLVALKATQGTKGISKQGPAVGIGSQVGWRPHSSKDHSQAAAKAGGAKE
jgi:hypothetical protein